MRARVMVSGLALLFGMGLMLSAVMAQDAGKKDQPAPAKGPEAGQKQKETKEPAEPKGKEHAGHEHGEKPAHPAAGQAGQMPDEKAMHEMVEKLAQPGPEHARLVESVGNWKTVCKSFGAAGEPETSEGTATWTAILGGRFVEEVFKSTFQGKPFEGRGIIGYDNIKKKYTLVWFDTMGTAPMTMEGDYDAATKTMTLVGESDMPGMGKMKFRSVMKEVSKTQRQFDMYMIQGDAPEQKMMEMTYTRS